MFVARESGCTVSEKYLVGELAERERGGETVLDM